MRNNLGVLRIQTNITNLYCWFYLAATMCVTGFAWGADLARYEGLIYRSLIDEHGNSKAPQVDYSFIAEVSSNRYRISIVGISELDWSESVVGSDGLDCYQLEKRWSSVEGKASNSGYKERPIVTSGVYPTMAVSEIQLSWLLLASNRTVTNEQTIALSLVSFAPNKKLHSKVKYSERGNFLESIEEHSPGILYINSREIPLPPPYDKGFKIWDFLVKETDDTGEVAFPKRAIFSQYAVVQAGPTNLPVLRKIREVGIKVTNRTIIHKAADDDLLPIISQQNPMAIDFRFSSSVPLPDMPAVDAVQYRLTERKWLDRNDPKVRAGGFAIRVLSESHRTKPSVLRYIILASILLVTVVGIFFLVKQSKEAS